MLAYKKSRFAASAVFLVLALCLSAYSQSGGNSTSVTGTVSDPSGAVVPNATVEIHNPVSQFRRSTTTDNNGNFSIPNVPFNPYHLSISAAGFSSYAQDIDVRSLVPLNVKASLKVSTSSEIVTVESGGDLVENDPTFHTDVDKAIVDRLPLETQSSSLSSAITLAQPTGTVITSYGSFGTANVGVNFAYGGEEKVLLCWSVMGWPMGDHAENSFSVDGVAADSNGLFHGILPLAPSGS